jgi:hypothetical protein
MPLVKARLADYCGQPASDCEMAGCDCDQCASREAAEERRRKGKTIIEEVREARKIFQL